MINLPSSLRDKINNRKQNNSFRILSDSNKGVDFYSNDYLGFSRLKTITDRVEVFLNNQPCVNGSTGSRLISGSHVLHSDTEVSLASFHQSESALLYNSGYDANIGLFSSILQKDDIVLYDELIHASVRDGIRLGLAKSFKFKHNNIEDLELKLNRFSSVKGQLYIAIESVYSMDGDMAPLLAITKLSSLYNAALIVDEAHSTGVFGNFGNGLVCELNLQDKVFARVHTFGKAMGVHGAVVLGSNELKSFLINFSRSFIYTTALPSYTVATILSAYEELQNKQYSKLLKNKISFFKEHAKKRNIDNLFIDSNSSIQCCVFPGNDNVKYIEKKMKDFGFLVKAVLSPTVPKGEERIRMCIHLFNTDDQIVSLLDNLSSLVI